jgi:hypothetical protein
MADVEDANFIFIHGKKNSVFVLAATIEFRAASWNRQPWRFGILSSN